MKTWKTDIERKRKKNQDHFNIKITRLWRVKDNCVENDFFGDQREVITEISNYAIICISTEEK